MYRNFNKEPELFTFAKKTNTIQTFKFKELGIPPKNILTNGSANPLGINCLYTSNEIETMISEVRAWKSSIVTVAEIISKNDLTAIEKLKSLFHFFSTFYISPFETIHKQRKITE